MGHEVKKLLFVCMGNICRSPTAHAVMQHKLDERGLNHLFIVDSAGTHAYHVGEPSDARSRKVARSKGIDMESIRARKISINDYDEYDFIFAMDDENLHLINYYAPPNPRAQIRLFLSMANDLGRACRTTVPDPYYGGAHGFDDVFDLVSRGCDAILDELLNTAQNNVAHD